jgi:ABC-2 type transport system permease protein
MSAAGAALGALFPYPMPDVDAHPFSTSLGGGVRATISVLVLVITSAVLCAPVTALGVAWLLGWGPGGPLAAIAGLGYAPALVAAGAWAAGALHDRRAPEILAVVSPRS